ncbi:phage repressor protein CI [Escherichia coli]
MNFKNGGQAVITRMLEAYGFKTRQALCEQFNVSASTMGTRWMRDAFPADWVIQCAIETGASIEWLSFGKGVPFPKNTEVPAKLEEPASLVQYVPKATTNENPIVNHPNLDSGGRNAINRLMEAYGFKTRQELADHLNVSKSTMANRYLRDTFPADWIIRCSLETRTSLLWLATGRGQKLGSEESEALEIPKVKLIDNQIFDAGHLLIDKSLLPHFNDLLAIEDEHCINIAHINKANVEDGRWIVQYQNNFKLKQIFLLPGGNLRVTDDDLTFDCEKEDIKLVAKIFSQYRTI